MITFIGATGSIDYVIVSNELDAHTFYYFQVHLAIYSKMKTTFISTMMLMLALIAMVQGSPIKNLEDHLTNRLLTEPGSSKQNFDDNLVDDYLVRHVRVSNVDHCLCQYWSILPLH